MIILIRYAYVWRSPISASTKTDGVSGFARETDLVKGKTMKKALLAAALGASVLLSACSTQQVAENTGNVVGFAAETAVKGVAFAGRTAHDLATND